MDLEVSGPELSQVRAAAGMLFGTIMQTPLGAPRPEPSNFNLGAPELQVVTDPVEEPVATARPDLDPEVVELIEAAILLIEAQKLKPLCEELTALGFEPAPRDVAETIERVLSR